MALSSIFSNSRLTSPNACPAFSISMRPKSFQPKFLSSCNIVRNFSDENGRNGSKAIAKLAAICSDRCKMVAVRSISVLASFQGSVSARYLLPIRARFIASLSASRKRKSSKRDSILDLMFLKSSRVDLS